VNAAGLTFLLKGVSAHIEMPFNESLVTDGHISQGELAITRHNLSAIIAILEKTPPEKIEAMVAKYNEGLTAGASKITPEGQRDLLGFFRNAQIMMGHFTTIMSKSGLRE
jgi:hypothetical protein